MQKIHRTWTERDGLPQNSITAIAPDAQGWLWVGTYDGAAYYNGQRWTIISLPNHNLSNAIPPQCLITKTDGSIWFGTEGGGLHKLIPIPGLPPKAWHWQSFDSTNSPAGNIVRSIHQDENGNIYCATDKGIAYFDGLSMKAISNLTANCVFHKAGNLYIGTDSGIYVYKGSSAFPLLKPPSINSHILCIGADRSGKIYFGTESEGVLIYDGKTFSCMTVRDGLPSNFISGIYQSKDDQLIFGTNNGISIYDGKIHRVFSEKDGLSSKVVFSLYTDSNRRMNIGTEVGLSIFEPGTFFTLTENRGLGHRVIWSIFGDSTGKMYFGTSAGLSVYDGNNITTFRQKHLQNPLTIRCIYPIDNKQLYLGTNEGVFIFNGRDFSHLATNPILPANTVLAIHKAPDGKTYFGTKDAGVVMYDGKTFSTLAEKDGLSSNYIYTIFSDKSGKVYFGTRGGGISIYDGKKIEIFRQENGLANNVVRCIHQDKKGWLYFGTNGGLSIYDGTQFVTLTNTSSPALPNNVIYQIQEDAAGRLYCMTNKGVCRISELGKPSGLSNTHFKVETFGTEDGLPSMEGNAGASWKDHLGRLWFGTINGAAMFDPTREFPDTTKKPTIINRVLIDGLADSVLKTTLLSKKSPKPIELSYNQNNLLFEYACLSFKRESETTYQAELQGYDRSPSGWAASFRKEYTNLPAGKYVFRVHAKDHAGNISEPAEFAFIIHPAPWQTWWAYASYVCLIIGLGYGIARRRILALEKRAEALEAKVAERTTEIVKQKDQLEKSNNELQELNKIKTEFLSIAAHDLKNPLQSILGFAHLIKEEKQNSENIPMMADAIYRSSKRMVDLIKDLLETSAIEGQNISLSKVMIDLGSLTRIASDAFEPQAKLKSQHLKFSIEDGCKVYADGDRLGEVMDNLISNAIKYSPEGKSIEICVRKIRVDSDSEKNQSAQERVRFEVKDEGQGLTKEDQEKLFGKFQRLSARPTGGESSTGLGLSIARQLVELQGGKIWAESAGKDKGTLFIV
ncbi:MAG: hypothetical protein HGB11_06925, partial [Chlorobiales bacterium]|nr:hypothetical protein [Chlorobiales bacterium]